MVDDAALSLGSATRKAIEQTGATALFLFKSLTCRWYYHQIIEQTYILGVKSLPLIIFISVFVGFISALSFVVMTGGIGSGYMGTALIKAILVEMGPTFTGLILAGRIGAKIASEVGSMRVTEQIDALVCLALEPMAYIINPRIIACLLMGPVFFIVSSVTALVAGQIITTSVLGVSAAAFYGSMRFLFSLQPIYLGLIKSIVFALLIGLFGCHCGYTTTGGALGVGKSTRDAVVMASLSILLSNFFLTLVL